MSACSLSTNNVLPDRAAEVIGNSSDSLLEGDGFELSVLREMGTVSSLRFVTFLEIPMASDVMTVVLQIRPPHAWARSPRWSGGVLTALMAAEVYLFKIDNGQPVSMAGVARVWK
jgi:hypothetical protein